jgi:hypothetical protein
MPPTVAPDVHQSVNAAVGTVHHRSPGRDRELHGATIDDVQVVEHADRLSDGGAPPWIEPHRDDRAIALHDYEVSGGHVVCSDSAADHAHFSVPDVHHCDIGRPTPPPERHRERSFAGEDHGPSDEQLVPRGIRCRDKLRLAAIRPDPLKGPAVLRVVDPAIFRPGGTIARGGSADDGARRST